jgi:hypothetical protein
MSDILTQGQNGNAFVTLFEDGTREIEYEDELRLEYPLNVDIKLSDRCPFGLDPRTKKSVCDFCHESARTDGQHGDIPSLVYRLTMLPKTTEIAVGINAVTDEVIDFLTRMRNLGYIVNGTVNQGLVQTGEHNRIIDLLYGIGVSFRSTDWNLTDPVYSMPNTVLHVIAGIDSFDTVMELTNRVGKILVLGEKDFGFNSGKVNLTSENHLKWYRNIHRLFDRATVSFDNLAVEQLNLIRFFKTDTWDMFYQGEESIYINAVDGVYAPSSRSSHVTGWNMSIPDYYASLG